MLRSLPRCLVSILAVAALPLYCAQSFAVELDDSLDVVAGTNRAAAKSQAKIDKMSIETRDLLAEYRKLKDSAEYEAAYTRELELLDAAQQEQILALKEQIAQAGITRQRIVPLMRSMVDALEQFVVLDLPFRQEERVTAVLQLKQRLNQADLSVSARFRLLLEAYQLEQDYGGTIEAWRGPLTTDGQELSVEYLRIGRVALYYQTLDGSASGYWDNSAQRWQSLDPAHNRELVQAMRVAKNLTAPQLLQLPLVAPGGES